MRSLRLFAILLCALLATGCQKLFTTSLAEDLQRDSYTISANISNADAAALIADSSTSPEALASLLSVLNDQAAAGDPGAAALAAEAAVGASGISETVGQTITDYKNGIDPDPVALVAELQAAANSEVVEGILNLQGATVDDIIANNLSPTELIFAAALIAANALPAGADPQSPPAGYQTNTDVQFAATLIEAAVQQIQAGNGDSSLAERLATLLNTGATLP